MRWYRSTVTARVLAVAAAAFCGWSGWSYWQAGHAEPVRFATARDQVERAGRAQIAALNTFDPRHADATLRRWLDATTGPLHDELQRSSALNRQKIEQARSGATGTVTDLAVTELDTRAGTARIIATVQVRFGGPPTGASTGMGDISGTGDRSGGRNGAGTGDGHRKRSGTGKGRSARTGDGTETGDAAGTGAGSGTAGPGVGRKRFTAVLTRGHEKWKLTALTAVPVGVG